MPSYVSSLLRVGALSAIMLLTACGRSEIGADHARDYFAVHRIELEQVIEQVKLCQPDSGRIDYGSSFRCWSSEGDAQDLQNTMRAADAEWIRTNYNEREGEERVLTSVYIAMPSTYGFSFAGVIEAFVYEITPETEATYERSNNGVSTVERQPVTDAPHHWFWWKIDR